MSLPRVEVEVRMNRLSPGAEWLPPDRCCFRVWAPRCGQVVLCLFGPDRQVSMQASGRGWHEVVVDDVQPGRRYLYRVGGGPDRPDPRSEERRVGQECR